MNALQKALVDAGLAKKAPKTHGRRHDSIKCRKCGARMDKKDGTNIFVCPECGNQYVKKSNA